MPSVRQYLHVKAEYSWLTSLRYFAVDLVELCTAGTKTVERFTQGENGGPFFDHR